MSEIPDGWSLEPLTSHVKARSGNSKIIKGKNSAEPRPGLTQGFSASGPDVWVNEAEYSGPGVVVSAVGARCGKTFLADGVWTAIANTHVLIPEATLDPRFLWYLTNNERYWVRSGTAQPFVKVKDTLARPHLIPPLDEQRRIVAILEDHLSRLDQAGRILDVLRHKAVSFRHSHLESLFQVVRSESPAQMLGHVARLKSGFAFSSKSWASQGTPVVKIANVRDGRVSMQECSFVSDQVADASQDFRVLAGDLLITLTGEIGAVGFYSDEREGRVNQRVARIDVNDPDVLDKAYLKLFLETPYIRSQMWAGAKGMAQPNLSPKQVMALPLPVPPLTTQRRLVEQVAAIDERAADLDRSLLAAVTRSTGLRRSLLVSAFTGQLTKESSLV